MTPEPSILQSEAVTTPTRKTPRWLLLLRFAPIIIQLVDDIYNEVKAPRPDSQDPLFATKMRRAQLRDELHPEG